MNPADRDRLLRRRQRLFGLDMALYLVPLVIVVLAALCCGGWFLLAR